MATSSEQRSPCTAAPALSNTDVALAQQGLPQPNHVRHPPQEINALPDLGELAPSHPPAVLVVSGCAQLAHRPLIHHCRGGRTGQWLGLNLRLCWSRLARSRRNPLQSGKVAPSSRWQQGVCLTTRQLESEQKHSGQFEERAGQQSGAAAAMVARCVRLNR